MMRNNDYTNCRVAKPDDAEIIETPVTSFWLDSEGILYSHPRDVERTEENVKHSLAILKERLGDKKVCMISDTTYTPPYTVDARILLAEEMPKMLKAVAVLSCSPLGKMIGSKLFMSKPLPYPVKMFDDPDKAKEWIRQYI
ncbi:MAG: hypothetical protein K0S32_3561 [Bacteroidetes bacterium]|jgi:hypothetical protein|nr:hypothetical protein [Bacteroidota bacterium]